MTDPAGAVTRYEYDAANRPVNITDPAGGIWRREYDARGNLVRQTDPAGRATAYAYNNLGQLIRVQDAKGGSQLIAHTDCSGKTTRLAYNALGHPVASTDAARHVTRFETDRLGQVTTILRPDGSRETLQYDAQGQVIASADGNGAATRHVYNGHGQLLQRQDANGHTLGYRYNRQLQLVGLINQNGDAYEFSYDHAGRLVSETGFDGKRTDYEYDTGGRLAASRGGKTRTEYLRDDAGRLLQKRVHYHTPSGPVTHRTRYQYDALGRLVWASGKLSYAYDPVGQLLQAAQPGLTETFRFDPAGNLTDGAPQKSPLANTAGKDHAHWEEGLEHLIEQPHGATRPPIAPVTRNLLKRYLGMRFDYDAQGNTIRKVMQGQPDEQPCTLTLHYDGENRLVKAVKPHADQVMEAEYFYDVFGRRTAKVVRTPKQARATGTYGMAHSADASEEITFFVWDSDTLLQEIQPERTITYLYEPDSFVPLAQVHSDTKDSNYDPEQVKLRRAEEEMRQASAARDAENLQWLKVTDKAGYEATERVIAQREEEERQQRFRQLEEEAQHDRIYFIGTDHLGTPQEVVSEDGRVVWLARYKAWGRIHRLEREEVRQPLRFQGQYEDAETGLYYNRYRYYDSDTARYLTQDPIGFAGGENFVTVHPATASMGTNEGRGPLPQCA